MKTTCKDCGADLEITDESTFVKCFKCGVQTVVDVEPPWALAGLDYVAPAPPSLGSERPPPPLRHDHAPASHRLDSLSPLSGELVEGDDLIYATCENCGKEFEGNASLLRCPFCGVTNTVDTAPPWAVFGDLEEAPSLKSSVPPPVPQRSERRLELPRLPPAQQERKWTPVAIDDEPTLQSTGKRAGGAGALAVGGVVAALGVGGFVLFAANEMDEPAPAAPAAAVVVPPALDIDRMEQELEGVVNAGETTPWSCEKAAANYESNRDLDIEFEPVPEGVFGEVLNHGSYLELCAVPNTTGVEVCAAIQRGRAVGVTVTTAPTDPVLEKCVEVRVRALRFPSYPALQVVRSAFVALEDKVDESEDTNEATVEASAVPGTVAEVPARVPGPLPQASSPAASPAVPIATPGPEPEATPY